jgi:predicted transcriptional regulator
MSTLELRELLLEKISIIENEELLQEIASLIEADYQFDDNYKMSAEEIAAINDGREQIKNGQFVTNEESNKRVGEWLKTHTGL